MSYDNSYNNFIQQTITGAMTGVYSEPEEAMTPSAPAARHDRRSMTDINRQQVSDMLAASEAKVDARLANFDTSIKTGFAELRAEFAELRTEMAQGRTEAGKQNHESVKWIIGSVFGMISLAVAIIGVLINLNKAEKPATAPAALPAPIVITVPSAAAPTQAPPPAK